MANCGEDFFQWYPNSNNEDNNVPPNNSSGAYRNPHPGAFSTDMVFNSREELIKWVRKMASSLGFVIVIKRSRRDSDGDRSNVVFQCDCGGMYRSNQTSSKHTGTRKTNCPYVNQFPEMFHRYIKHVHDVIGDGNCGFRAIAVWIGLHEHAWPTIRFQLMEELDAYKTEYVDMFGSDHWNTTYNTLNFFRTDQGAPYDHWMTMPEIPVLIACKYNVILHVMSMAGCMTYLPLRSTPPAWYQHVIYTIGYVNGNHYVKLDMAEEYPFPRITQHFDHYRYPCAAGWATPYSDRIQKYERLLHVNCTTDNVILE